MPCLHAMPCLPCLCMHEGRAGRSAGVEEPGSGLTAMLRNAEPLQTTAR